MPLKRKFQVCNGYLLEFDQLARLLSFMSNNPSVKRIRRKELAENTGLSNRQIASLVSVGSAMGLIQRGKQTLSPVGTLIAKHDIFIEAKGTLEWCHYSARGSYKNLIWYEIFNKLLPDEQPMTREGWTGYLRSALAGKYTDRTMGKHLQQEVRFVIDAYLNRNFKKLELLHQTSDGRLYARRYITIDPLVFSSILYDYADKRETKLLQVMALTDRPGSPGRLFAMDDPTIRSVVEQLHEKGWVHYEGTHNLDQIRLREGFTALEFLKAYYEEREPCQEP
ncbi:DUF4007 family protein [bacterium]|nr:DUF4007 family protein [bacterium]